MVRLSFPQSRMVHRLLAAMVVFMAAYYGFNFVQVWRAASSTFEPDANTEVSAAVVLGAAQYNGQPSPVLASRLDIAADLFHQGHVGLIVVTGGGQQGDVTTEAKTGYDYLRAAGVPDSSLRLEVQGGSTYESLAATSRFLGHEGVDQVVIVTDGYHMYRSMLVASEVGLSPTPAPTNHVASMKSLMREGAAVSVGRVVGFRRLEQL